MYIDADTIIKLASLLTALGVIIGAVITVYKSVERDREQGRNIQRMQSEQQLIIYGLLCCLKGLKEQGCNGPVTEALNKLEKYLNQAAHESGENK